MTLWIGSAGDRMRTQMIGARFYATLAVAVVLTFIVHEAAHWMAGVGLGYEMQMRINGGVPIAPPGTAVTARDAFIISAAGPVATALQAILAFALIRTRGSLPAYAFLFVAWFMRFAAAFVSMFNPNDEARMSVQLGWNMWLLPGVVVSILLLLTWAGAR